MKPPLEPSSPGATPRGRRASQKDRVLRGVRRLIVSGKFGPGDRMPNRVDLERRFDAGTHTVQDAMQELIADGFIGADAGRGTFVASRPPHLFRYGMVFPTQPWMRNWSSLWEAFRGQASAMEGRDGTDIAHFCEVSEHTDVKDHRRLIADLDRQRLAGLIFTFSPFSLLGSPILEAPGVPRVALMASRDERFPHVAAVAFDLNRFIGRAMAHLAARGRKRVGILMLPDFDHSLGEQVVRQARAAGMETRSEWMQMSVRGHGLATRRLMQLFFSPHLPARERPDALIISDDNLVEHATLGLRDLGIDASRDIDIVALGNYPALPPASVPVTWLGFDARATLAAMLRLIEDERAGVAVPDRTLVKPLFENEVTGYGQ